MDLLAACLFVVVGCHEYATTECAADSFYAWEPVPFGQLPARCENDECLPMDWEACEVVRRVLEDCAC